MDQDLRLNNLKRAPRCGAGTRAGAACQRPAIRGRRRCRLHGGLSPGAPRGTENGNFTALAVQMACTHTAAMAVLGNLNNSYGTERRIAAFGSTAARLMKAFAMQMEVLRRLRRGGQQVVRVEHVHVNDSGQAFIGNLKKEEGKA